jgi:hypothetical protein
MLYPPFWHRSAKTTLFGFMLLLSGCVNLVADYDAELANETITISKQVDRFYGQLAETNYSLRSYDAFRDRYIEIEVNLRSLVMRNKVRPLNENSIKIAENTLKLWIKYKDAHKQNWEKYQEALAAVEQGEENAPQFAATDIYKDGKIKLHRKRFTRMFTALTVAEEAKKMGSDQGDVE